MSGVCRGLAVVAGEIEVEGGCHRRSFGRGSLEVETETGIGHRLGGCRTERADLKIALLEIGEILEQRVDTLRAEEDEHIVIERLVGSEIIADSAVHHRRSAVELVFGKERAVGAVVDVAHREEEFLGLVLEHRRHEIGEFTGLGSENLAFAVYYILLKIVGHCLGGAEIFHGHRNGDTHLLAETEEIVDRRLGGEYDGCEFGYVYLLGTEFFCAESFNLYERTEYNLDAIFLRYLEIRRFIGSRFRLGYQDFINLHFVRDFNSHSRGQECLNIA